MHTELGVAQSVVGARRTLALLLAINLFNYIDRYMLAAVVPRIKTEFFTPEDPNVDARVGLLFMAFLLSYMVAAPVFGWLADRMSRWLIIGVGVIFWSLASGATGLAETYLILFGTRVLVGLGEAAYGPAAPTVIADAFPAERRGRVLSWFYMAIPVGSAVGYAWGGFMAEAWNWRWAFYLSVPPGILLGLVCLAKRDNRRSEGNAPLRKARAADYLVLARTPSYVLNTLGMASMTFAVGGIASWMPDYVFNYRHQPDLAHINIVFGVITACAGLTATLAGGMVGDKLRPRIPGAYFLVSGIGMFLAWPLFLLVLVTPFPAAWVLIFLSEFCLFFNTGPTNTILANVTHPSMRASAFALNICLIHLLGDAISPTLIGGISDLAGGNMNVGFAFTSVAILLGGVFWVWGTRYLERDTELAPTRIADA